MLPAAGDQCIATFGTQIHQVDEPARHAVDLLGDAALHQHLPIFQVGHADVAEIAAVENRADHQLHHRRVVDLGGQGQAQGGRGVLGMGAQLAQRLLARAFQAGIKTAAERHQQEQADGKKQLVAQFHRALLGVATNRRRRRILRFAFFSGRLASATVFSSRRCAGGQVCRAGTGLRR
ncbi:hypothetical protein D3C81_1743590 [compost metagenome]